MRTPMHSQRIDNGTLWTVTALLIGSMAAILVATMVNLAVPTLTSDFNAATTEI